MRVVEVSKSSRWQRSLASAALVAVLTVSGGLGSCTKEDTGFSSDSSEAAKITLSATVQAADQTRAAVDGASFPASTNNVFRLTAFAGTAAPTTNWSAAPYFNDIQVNSAANQILNLATTQYYPLNGNKVYFYAYAPSATSLAAGTASKAPVASYTIDGQQDIMAAQHISGIAKAGTGTQSQPQLQFTHKLMQLKFKIVKDNTFPAGLKVTQILVKGARTSAKLDISNGTLTFDGTANNMLSLPITPGTNDEITTAGTEMDGCVMLEPVGTNGKLMLQVTANGVSYDNIEVPLSGLNSGTAGTSHLITLTFKLRSIIPSATITDWKLPAIRDVIVSGDDVNRVPTVGDFYYFDGTYSTELQTNRRADGLIFWVDPSDPARYKVLLRDAPATPEKWSAKPYYIGSLTYDDGKRNAAAIRAAWDARTTADGVSITESSFDAAFPAAAYCYNYIRSGTYAPGTWYLPSLYELEYLFCAYNDIAPVSWGPLSPSPSLSTNTTVQDVWNSRIRAGGYGEELNNAYYITSSEEGSINKGGFYVLRALDFGVGTTSKMGTNFVRCIRDVIPPPAVGDYYYSDGTFSTRLWSGKTATGIIFWVDPSNPEKYKVMSLKPAMEFSWSANDGYEVGTDDGDSDGRANAAAIKAKWDAKLANIPITESSFDAAFPAAAYCYNYTGMKGTDAPGTWYLPAKNELQYLWCAYNGVAPITWSSGTSTSAPASDAAQDAWNARMQAAGIAAGNPSGHFWSSTEYSINIRYAWCVNFSNGYTSSGRKGGGGVYVRCVREI